MKITKTIKHLHKLKFTPLEFETPNRRSKRAAGERLKFTPLEFETLNLTVSATV